MNKQKELAVNTAILTIGKICTQFVSFMLLPLYTALLTPEEYGIVDLFNTYILLLVPLFNWQFENGLFRFMVDCRGNEKKQKELFSTVFITNVCQIILYIMFYILLNRYMQSEYKIFLAIDVVLNIMLNTLMQFPRGLGNNVAYAMASFISAFITIIFNVFFIAGLKMGAYGMFCATVIAKMVTLLYLILSQKVWRFFSYKLFNRKLFKEVSEYSLPLIPNQLSWWVIGASDRTVISHTLGVFANGIYTVANKFPSLFSTFYSIFNMSWTESVAVHMYDEDRDVFLEETINTMFRFFAAANIGIIACMPFVFPIMVDSQYQEAYYQIPILMIGILFQVVMGLFSVIFVALKKSAEIAKTTVYAAITNLVVDIVLIKFIGLYAASISTLVAFAVVAIYRYYNVRKYVNVKLDSKLVIFTTVVGTLTVVSYYYDRLVTNILTLFIVAVFSVVTNKKMIIIILETIKEKNPLMKR